MTLRVRPFFAVSGALSVLLAGCAPRPQATALAGTARLPAPLGSARSYVSEAVTAAASVQALPAYAEAKLACSHGKYRKAADILARMQKSPALTEEQKEFCYRQERICLGHLSPHQSVSKSSAQPRTPSHSPARSADCGPRALLLACRKLGVKTTLADLKRAAGTGPRGTSLVGLKRAAEGLGLKTEGVQASREALPDQPVPAIAWSHGDHFLTVLAWNGRGERGTATVQDPNEATPRSVSQEKLLQASGGYLLTLRR